MIIGFDAKRAFCNSRGLGNYSRSLISSLVKYFPENIYHLFTPKIKQDFNYFLVHEDNVNRHLPQGLPLQKLHPLWRSFKMADNIRSMKVDLFHGLSHELPNGLRREKIRSIVTIHDLMYIHFPHFFPWIDRIVYDKKVRYACKNSDSIIAICEQTKNDLIKYYDVLPEKITVQYQSIDERYFQELNESYELPDNVSEKGYILGVGAFVQNKNFEGLIRAFGKIHKLIKEDLVLVGSGTKQKRSEYYDIAKKLGCELRVHFLADVSTKKLPSLYKRASLFVLPSFHEGFGLPIIEAMSQGCPVVTTGGGAHQESAGDAAIFINPNSLESLSDGITQVIENKEKALNLMEKGRSRAQMFHPEVISQQVFQHYEKVIAKF